MHKEEPKASDPGALLTQAMSHALAYRRSLAEDPRLPSADYHAMLERFAGAMPEQGTPPARSLRPWPRRPCRA
jgi:hypothetical protein